MPMLIAGYGVIKRRKWGRILTLVLGAIAALFAGLSLMQFNLVGAGMYGSYAALVFSVLLKPEYAAEFS